VILTGPDVDRLVEAAKAELAEKLRAERQENGRLRAKVKDQAKRLGQVTRQNNTLQASVHKMRKASQKG
jgi:uncharacterized protein YlxW (UPF0749 family)